MEEDDVKSKLPEIYTSIIKFDEEIDWAKVKEDLEDLNWLDFESQISIDMALTLQDTRRIAHLARLELSDAEQALMLDQLNGFFGIVEQMSAVDTRGVEPLYTPLSAVHAVSLRLRDDVVTESDDRQANQRSAPAVEDGLFLVPKVLE